MTWFALVFPSWALRTENAVLRAKLDALQARYDERVADVRYWRVRAEKFLDVAAGHAGLIDQPTMHDDGRTTFSADPIAAAFAGLGMTSIPGDRHDN